jgi:hypothetical protein
VLEPQTSNVTRLTVRVHGDYRSRNAIMQHLRAMLMRPVHSVMERKQLRNLKQRAEGLASTMLPKPAQLTTTLNA